MRLVEPGDLPFLEALYREARAHEVAAWGWPAPTQDAFLHGQFAAFRRSLDALEGRREWVLLSGVEPVGALVVADLGQALRVVQLTVATRARRQGHARRALEQLLAQADAQGRAVELHVDHGNPARRLYEALGFEVRAVDQLGATLSRPAPTSNP